ncbi:hypothetical protein ZWY2020_006533 [Hordeum vulgare]|nr:hypothetical protein ZWY2020_006533 [Hordeum vulgare]
MVDPMDEELREIEFGQFNVADRMSVEGMDGRARLGELARKNQLLQKEIEEKEAEKKAQKEKHKMEKRMIAKIHKEVLVFRDRMLVFAISIYFGLCAILFALAVKK